MREISAARFPRRASLISEAKTVGPSLANARAVAAPKMWPAAGSSVFLPCGHGINHSLSNVGLARNDCYAAALRSPERIEGDDHIGQEGHGIGKCKAVSSLGDEAHCGRQNCSADDGHDQQRAAEFRVWA